MKNPKNAETIDNNNLKSQLKAEEKVDIILSSNMQENLEKFKAFLEDSTDAVFREFYIGINRIPCAIVYIDGLIDKTTVSNQILKSLTYQISILETNTQRTIDIKNAFDEIKAYAVTIGDIKEADSLDEGVLGVLSGDVAVIIDGSSKLLIVSARGWPTRGISEPQAETVIRGSHEGFSETLRFNTALLRRRCKDPNFTIKTIQLGRRSKTDVAYAYIKGIVNPGLVEEVERRLNSIDIDAILDAGQVEQLIQDSYITPFPQVQVTERPDKTIANIVEGRIAILVDNSPYALIVPVSFYQFLQSPDDYFEKWMFSSIMRVMRWVAYFLTIFTPGIYIAVTSFHPGFIPTSLAISIAATRATVPFPVFIEATLMEITFELLREAGARLPKPIGSTIGIVGGIIIGDASVRAGITSPIMVIVVAITAIASFAIPTYSVSITLRLLRFPVMVAAAISGIYGVILSFLTINIHMVTLKSFGMDYMTPRAPIRYEDMKDFLIRPPIQTEKRRPISLLPVDMDRQDQ